jgi:hypothetical protein
MKPRHLALAAALAWLTPAKAADLRALLMGVDNYEHEHRLGGSVNDSMLLAEALRPPVTRELVLMLDQQVLRDPVLKAMDRLLMESAPGDTVLVAFSGHGAVDIDPAFPQGYRLFWAMADVDTARPDIAKQVIYSDEIAAWIDRARARGVHAILLADNCHSGRIYRSLGVDVPKIRSLLPHRKLASRDGAQMASRDGAAPVPAMVGENEPPPPPGVTSLAGERSTTPVTEIKGPDGKQHGALSYAFADALLRHREAIAPGGDGKVIQAALLQHLQDEILALSHDTQDPQLRSVDPDGTVLFTLPAGVAAPAEAGTDKPVALHVTGATDAAAIAGSVPGAVWEPDPDRAQLVWQLRGARSGPLVNEMNMFVSFDATLGQMPAAIAQVQAVDALSQQAVDSGMHIARVSSDGLTKPVYFPPEELTLRVEGLAGRNLVLFNIAHDGTVQYLYPDTRYFSPVAWPSSWFELRRIAVEPPFGGDHVVAVSSASSLAALQGAIRDLDGQRDPRAARRAIEQALAADRGARLAVAALYTAPADKRCDPDVVRDAVMKAACP